MFETRVFGYKEALIIPQSNHGAMTASLVEQWGNDRFDRPLHIESLVEAAASHHLGAFKFLDTKKINGSFSPQELAQMFEDDSRTTTSDIMARVHILYHNLRVMNAALLNGSAGNDYLREVFAHVKQTFYEELPHSGLAPEEVRLADEILCLCDKMSFDFCNQTTKPRQLNMKPAEHSPDISIAYQVGIYRSIQVNPWPFQNPQIHGFVQAYSKSGYPQNLDSRRIPYAVIPNPNLTLDNEAKLINPST